jgi:hypothetical protein
MGAIRNACTIFVGKPEGKSSLEIPWEDNIKSDIRKIWLEGVDLTYLAQDRDR